MTIVTSGTDKEGNPLSWSMDEKLKLTLDAAKERVIKHKHDYVIIVAGLPSSGKSQFAQGVARYLCPWFDENYICFTGDQFTDTSSNVKKHSSIILDESFQSLNSRVTMSGDFLRVVNHLQLLRQQGLFIILCLPNYFDLSKGIAIFRSHHLFVTYTRKDGSRGPFLAFDRDSKRKLYVRGQKFMDYNAERANFYGTFSKSHCIDEDLYESLKKQHLKEQAAEIPGQNMQQTSRDKLILDLKFNQGWKTKKIAESCGLDKRTIQRIVKRYRDVYQKSTNDGGIDNIHTKGHRDDVTTTEGDEE